MTSIKYDHLQVMGTISGKLHQNPLKTVGKVAETRFRKDGLPDGPITIAPFDYRRGTINGYPIFIYVKISINYLIIDIKNYSKYLNPKKGKKTMVYPNL